MENVETPVPGYYPGALLLTATGSSPLTVPVALNVFPTGYLQLTMPYAPASNQASFNGGTLSFSFTNSTPPPATVHVNVFDINSVNNTPYSDSNDDHQQLSMSVVDSSGSPAPWLTANLTDPNTHAPTSKSPANLTIGVDPTKAPAGSQNVFGTVSISSGPTEIGYDFVRVSATLPQAPPPQFSVPSLSLSFASASAASQAFSLGSSGAPISYQVASNSTWLSAAPASGVTPQTLTVTVDPTGLTPGVYNGNLTISDSTGASPAVRVSVAFMVESPSQVTRITGVAHEASFAQSFAPGMLMSVFGTALSSGAAQTVAAAPLPLTAASGTSVNIDQFQAPLLYISATQINLQIPYEVAVGSHTLTVRYNGQSTSIQFSVQAAAPGIYVDPQNHIVPSGTVPTGSTIAFYTTGVGLVTPSEPTGGIPVAGTTPLPNLPLTLSIGGNPVTPVYAGIPGWSVGELQINFTVPSTPGTYPVVVTIGGVSSPPAMLTVTQ